MKKSVVSISVVVLLCGFFAAATAGAHWPGERWGNGGCRTTGETETFSGEVTAVKELEGRRGPQGVGIELNTGTDLLFVRLGPSFYMEKQPVKIAAGDKVEIIGAKLSRRGDRIIIADQVKKGSEVLKLRDENGVPLWAGTGPGPRGFQQ